MRGHIKQGCYGRVLSQCLAQISFRHLPASAGIYERRIFFHTGKQVISEHSSGFLIVWQMIGNDIRYCKQLSQTDSSNPQLCYPFFRDIRVVNYS